MNPKSFLRVLAAAMAALLLASAVLAQSGGVTGGRGLNGTNYLSPTYLYSDIDDGSPDSSHGFGLRYNQVLAPSFDLIVTASLTQSNRVGSSRVKWRDLEAGVRWHTDIGQARPFVEATIGYTWWDFANFDDSSFTYAAGIGAEFQLSGNFSIAPLVGYSEATDFSGSGDAFVVLRTNYWLNSRWSIRVNISFSDDARGLGAGVAWGF